MPLGRAADFYYMIVCVRKFSNYVTRIPKIAMDFNDDVSSMQVSDNVCWDQQAEFCSFTIHHHQRCICLQISAELTRLTMPTGDTRLGHAV